MVDWKPFNEVDKDIVLNELSPSEALARISELGKKEKDTCDLTVWDELPGSDWSKEIETVGRWFKQTLDKLAEWEKVDLLDIELGDNPDVFWTMGNGFKKGQKDVEAYIESHAEIGGWDFDFFRPSKDVKFLNKKVKALGGKLWEAIDVGDDSEPYVNTWAGYIIWYTLALLAVTAVLRSGKVDFPAILGKRKQVVMYIGFEDAPHLLGLLAPEGWKPDYR